MKIIDQAQYDDRSIWNKIVGPTRWEQCNWFWSIQRTLRQKTISRIHFHMENAAWWNHARVPEFAVTLTKNYHVWLHTCMCTLLYLCKYWLARWACRSSLRCANATYNGFPAMMRLFISVTAFVASSGLLKQTKPNPFDRPLSIITLLQQHLYHRYCITAWIL